MADSPPKPASVKPPKAASAKSPKPPADSPPPRESPGRGRPPVLKKQLEEMFLGLSMGAAVIGDQFDGEIIAENAEELAEVWYKLALQNAAVKRTLEAMMQTGAWSGVLMTTAAIVVPIAQNHGAIPPNVPHPFRKPPRIAMEQAVHHGPGSPINGNVPPQKGSPITPNGARVPPEPPPGQHKFGS